MLYKIYIDDVQQEQTLPDITYSAPRNCLTNVLYWVDSLLFNLNRPVSAVQYTWKATNTPIEFAAFGAVNETQIIQMYKALVCFGSVTSGANGEKGGLQLNKMYHIKLIHADIIIALKGRLKLPVAYMVHRIQIVYI